MWHFLFRADGGWSRASDALHERLQALDAEAADDEAGLANHTFALDDFDADLLCYRVCTCYVHGTVMIACRRLEFASGEMAEVVLGGKPPADSGCSHPAKKT